MTGSSSKQIERLAIPSGGRVAGELSVPGSKSVTQRYLNLALVGRLPLRLERPLLSEDPRLFLEALRRCGFEVRHGENAVFLEPLGEAAGGDVFCGNGGTMFRFLTAALTTVPGIWRLDGIERLRERPIAALVDALRLLGARIDYLENPGFAPLKIVGGSLRGGESRLEAGASSQYLSALLMASLAAPEPTRIEVESLTSAPYVTLTLDAIETFGGRVERPRESIYEVSPSPLVATSLVVEADDSAAAYPAAAALLTGGRVRIRGLRRDSRQGDRGFLDLLGRMGAEVRWRDELVEIRGGPLRRVEVDMSSMPDQVPTLAALAPFAVGTTKIFGVPHLRIKESDRLAAMARELERLGAEVEEQADGLVIPGVWASSTPPSNAVDIATYGDHRIAMSFALVGLRRPGVTILNPGVVEKSYPDFWRDLSEIAYPGSAGARLVDLGDLGDR